jgi:hypothetical protein
MHMGMYTMVRETIASAWGTACERLGKMSAAGGASVSKKRRKM